jgi:hypothetical protein
MSGQDIVFLFNARSTSCPPVALSRRLQQFPPEADGGDGRSSQEAGSGRYWRFIQIPIANFASNPMATNAPKQMSAVVSGLIG